jgi:hypothetical protein
MIDAVKAPGSTTCPPWCVTAHDPARGEDDWLHASEPLVLTGGVAARLCTSIEPRTGEEDGPYVLVGDDQFMPVQAQRLGIQLSELAAAAGRRELSEGLAC